MQLGPVLVREKSKIVDVFPRTNLDSDHIVQNILLKAGPHFAHGRESEYMSVPCSHTFLSAPRDPIPTFTMQG